VLYPSFYVVFSGIRNETNILFSIASSNFHLLHQFVFNNKYIIKLIPLMEIKLVTNNNNNKKMSANTAVPKKFF